MLPPGGRNGTASFIPDLINLSSFRCGMWAGRNVVYLLWMEAKMDTRSAHSPAPSHPPHRLPLHHHNTSCVEFLLMVTMTEWFMIDLELKNIEHLVSFLCCSNLVVILCITTKLI